MTALILGCANAATQGGAARGSGNTLSSTQLGASNAENLYDAIVRLRPSWLTSRGPTSVTDATPTGVDVFMAGTYLGKADYLQQLRVADVTEVHYWDAASASARFG
ncbi:MAG: hypothetical protein ACREBE_17350, partial [bacterium]